MVGSLSQAVQAAGQAPALQALAIIGATFVLEDAATAGAVVAVQAGAVTLPLALVSLYAGIVLGDLGLYGVGALAARRPWFRRWIPAASQAAGQVFLRGHVGRVVFVCRFIPGARLPTYTACGFLGADLARFTAAAIAATLIWTSGLFALSLRVGGAILTAMGAWRWAGAAGFLVAIVAIGRLMARGRAP